MKKGGVGLLVRPLLDHFDGLFCCRWIRCWIRVKREEVVAYGWRGLSGKGGLSDTRSHNQDLMGMRNCA